MKLLSVIILLCLTVFSCGSDQTNRRYPLDSILSDGSSKVWMVKHISYKNHDFTPHYFNQKDVFIFYSSNKVFIQPFQLLGKASPKRGEYVYHKDEHELSLYFDEEAWHFKVMNHSKDSLSLSPLKKSDFNYAITLESLPEF